jgi:tagaturonate epimerase
MSTLTSIGLDVVTGSVVTGPGVEFGLTSDPARPRLVVRAETPAPWLDAFEGERTAAGGRVVLVGPASPRNAAALRSRLPWLRPVPLGLRTSAGFGDRTGLATPGHVRAIRAAGGRIAPVFAQQSMREMTRIGRSASDVIDDAMWGVFREGWCGGYGSDADHLKTTADIDVCVAAGFTGVTVDPGAFVRSEADAASAADLQAALASLPWDRLEDTEPGFVRRYLDRVFDVDGHTIRFDRLSMARAAVKYGQAVAHVVTMFRHLVHVAAEGRFELEVSVDETDTPTTPAEHFYVASELKRLGVAWVGLAPRFVGRFEKGVDYIGDLAEFERDLALHAAIARHMGPYKLSLHSGSDKFAIYPAAARETRGLVHLKTAGTSYLEALRTVADVDPGLFREMYAFSRDRYESDRATYHVSATLDRAPLAGSIPERELPRLLDQFDARQILHVTFGSVLSATTDTGRKRFSDRFMALLAEHREQYAAHLEAHFRRHLAPFVG